MGLKKGNVEDGMGANTKTIAARVKVIAAIPCFNTERTIGEVVSRTSKYVDKVIVVNDGSVDSTAEKARASGATVINHPENRGYGETTKSCFEAAKAEGTDVLVIFDGDGQHDPDDIPMLLAPILSGKAEVVIGSRFLDGKTEIPKCRKIGIQAITFLYNFASKTKVSDSQSGFRAYNRKIIENLPLSEKGMSVSIEILEEARRRGAVISEVPITCRYFSSNFNLGAVKHGLSVVLPLFKIRLRGRLFARKKQP